MSDRHFGMNAPDVSELLQNSVVTAALESAWTESSPDDPELRHEEGGWIYIDARSGEIIVRRAEGGEQAAIDLRHPPVIKGAFLIATFHTHPNPTRYGWEPGPSSGDTRSAWILGVPCIIRGDDGIYTTGPESRRGGLGKSPGFPARIKPID